MVQETSGRPFAMTAGTNVLLSAVGAAGGILSARLLGASGRGALAAIQTLPNLLAMVTLLGMPEALVYFSARQGRLAGRYLGSATLLCLAASVPITVFGYLAAPAILSGQESSTISAARRYLVIVPLFALTGVGFHALRGTGNFLGWNLCRIFPAVAWTGLLLYTWRYGTASASRLSNTYLAVLAVAATITAAITVRAIRGPYWPHRGAFGPLMRFGLPAVVTALPQGLNFRLDQLVMASAVAPRELGLYVAALAWSTLLLPITSAIGSALYPALASLDGAMEQRARLVRHMNAAVFVTAVSGTLAAIAAPVALPLLFGSEYRSALPAALTLIVAAAILSLVYVLEEAMRGLGKPAIPMRAEFAGLLGTIPVLVLLVKPLGILGAAVSSIIGYSISLAVLLRNLSNTEFAVSPRQLLSISRPELIDIAQVMRGVVSRNR